ncbi:putative major facilitator superfamily transporter protein [Echria macrotheca]|uniref:Major facilitator superfamily transporter protein n=1 Tax=Echria macrotheca TaxID=438768 RepID=A0AAJ0F8D7_9PEZI|nr:putative major facilitator superfamily transporter protein [Echria macrotheca]
MDRERQITRPSDASDTDRTTDLPLNEKDVEDGTRLPPREPTKEEDTSDTTDIEQADGQPTTPNPPAGNAPPDGGLTAWLQVLGAFVLLIATWGVINSFGVFQAYYEEVRLPDSSASDISWIGSLQAALLLLVGIVSGPLFDAGYFQAMMRTGLFMVIFGLFMTSICKAYWQFLLAQGFCIGIGMGLLFLPATGVLSQYFARHRSLVIGVSSAGSPLAGIVFPIIFTQLEQRVGFGWATRVIAFILLGLSIVPLIFMRPRLPPSGRRAEFDSTAVRDLPFITFSVAGFFSFMALYVPFFYISLFATSHHISSPDFAPYLVTLLNAGSIFGRIVPNALADRFGALNVLTICMAGTAAVCYGWFGIHDTAGAVVFALLYGALSGGVVSLTPSVVVSMSPDMSRVGARMGVNFLLNGIALLIGTPIAGAIVNGYTEARWKGTMAFAATSILIGTGLYVMSRWLVYRRIPVLKF